MLKIRLQRVGRKHEPAFRLVLTDSQNSSKSGRFQEVLGSYDPRKTTDVIKKDRVEYWLSKGVKLSDTVHNLLVSHKVIDAKKKNVLPVKTYTPPVVEAAPEAAPADAEAVADKPVETTEAPVETPAESDKIEETAVETPAE